MALGNQVLKQTLTTDPSDEKSNLLKTSCAVSKEPL